MVPAGDPAAVTPGMKQFFTALSVVVCLVFATVSYAGDDQVVNVAVPKADQVAIRLPATWKQTIIQPRQDLPPTVMVVSDADALTLQLTFLPNLDGRFDTKDSVDRVVTQANQQYVSGSVEKRFGLTQLDSHSGHGCYSTFTDADFVGMETLPDGQFRYVASGLFVVGKQAVAFTLLTNSTDGPGYRRAIQVVSEGILVP